MNSLDVQNVVLILREITLIIEYLLTYNFQCIKIYQTDAKVYQSFKFKKVALFFLPVKKLVIVKVKLNDSVIIS